MSTSPAVVTAGNERWSAAAGRILEAAAELFAAKGFDAVSINAIATAAGVSKANVFHHFSSKEALYLAVLKEACAESSAALADMEDSSGNRGPFKRRFATFVQEHLANLLKHQGTARLILREVLDTDPKNDRLLAEDVVDQNFSTLVRILRDGQRRGELRADIDPAMIATLIVGANVFFFQASGVLRHLPDVDFADAPQRYAQALSEVLLNGLTK